MDIIGTRRRQVFFRTQFIGGVVLHCTSSLPNKLLLMFQLSFVADTATTSNKSIYSTLVKVNQASDQTNPLRIRMMTFFKWRRVGTITFSHEIYVSVS